MIPYAQLVEALRSYRARSGMSTPEYAPPAVAQAQALHAYPAPTVPPQVAHDEAFATPAADGATDEHAAIAAAPAPLAALSPALEGAPPEQAPSYDPLASDDPFGDLEDHTQLTDLAMVAPVVRPTPEGHADSTSEIDVTADIDIDEEP